MFGKWFSSAYTGSMYGAGPVVFSVWAWVIANAGADGVLEINPELLAGQIGTGAFEVEEALEFLCSPDPRSRSKAHDGARLVRDSEFLYVVVNHDHYRSMRDGEVRREQNREAKRRQRQRESAQNADSQHVSAASAAVSPVQKTENRVQKTELKKASPAKPSTKPPPQEALEIAQYLYDAIKEHSPEFMANAKGPSIARKLTRWAHDVARGMRIDGMTGEGCREAIDAAHRSADGFWRKNLLSGAKLRKHYEALRIKDAPKTSPVRTKDPLAGMGEFKFQEFNARKAQITGKTQ